jgi:hypothetical protein
MSERHLQISSTDIDVAKRVPGRKRIQVIHVRKAQASTREERDFCDLWQDTSSKKQWAKYRTGDPWSRWHARCADAISWLGIDKYPIVRFVERARVREERESTSSTRSSYGKLCTGPDPKVRNYTNKELRRPPTITRYRALSVPGKNHYNTNNSPYHKFLTLRTRPVPGCKSRHLIG